MESRFSEFEQSPLSITSQILRFCYPKAVPLKFIEEIIIREIGIDDWIQFSEKELFKDHFELKNDSLVLLEDKLLAIPIIDDEDFSNRIMNYLLSSVVLGQKIEYSLKLLPIAIKAVLSENGNNTYKIKLGIQALEIIAFQKILVDLPLVKKVQKLVFNMETVDSNYCSRIGKIMADLKNYHLSEKFLIKSLEIRQKNYSADSSIIAASLTDLGLMHLKFKQFDLAKQFLEESLKIEENQESNNIEIITSNHEALGSVYYHLGHYRNSQNFLEKCLKIHQKNLGYNYLTLSSTLTKLAKVYRKLNQLEKAEKAFLECINIQILKNSSIDIKIYKVYFNLGLFYFQIEKFKNANEVLLQCLEIQLKTLSSAHLIIAKTYKYLALVQEKLLNYNIAKHFIIECQNIIIQNRKADEILNETENILLRIEYAIKLGKNPENNELSENIDDLLEVNKCMICFERDIKLIRINCNHHFCKNCYDQIIILNIICPFCRTGIVSYEEVNENQEDIIDRNLNDEEVKAESVLSEEQEIKAESILKKQEENVEFILNDEEVKIFEENKEIFNADIENFEEVKNANEVEIKIQNIENDRNILLPLSSVLSDEKIKKNDSIIVECHTKLVHCVKFYLNSFFTKKDLLFMNGNSTFYNSKNIIKMLRILLCIMLILV